MRIHFVYSGIYFGCLFCDLLLIVFFLIEHILGRQLMSPSLIEYCHRVRVVDVLYCICKYGKEHLVSP